MTANHNVCSQFATQAVSVSAGPAVYILNRLRIQLAEHVDLMQAQRLPLLFAATQNANDRHSTAEMNMPSTAITSVSKMLRKRPSPSGGPVDW